uniref:Mitochondrial carrier protein n=1 Tax=Hanusia phi TaxID=3032 RepID=A0A7S0HWR6_9CRYP|mmetsp:Transcript_5089/g.12028  ORF Transcript_5089/g.12028 Transcript_5089/m.12028 type:complete len:354 (+) Transcript_5089:14-1075(+)
MAAGRMKLVLAAALCAALLCISLHPVRAESEETVHKEEEERVEPKQAKKQEVKNPATEVCSLKGDRWKNYLTQSEKMWGGAFARLCAQTLLHPIDTLRTRRQVRGGLPSNFRDLCKGIIPQMLGAMPAGAIQFIVYERSKKELNATISEKTLGWAKPWVVEICSASLGAVAASAIRVPQERIKQPVQADVYKNWIEACKGNWNEKGVSAFFVGSKATVLRDVPWNAFSFIFFKMFKTFYEQQFDKSLNQQETLAMGAMGGALAAIVMTPVDVVKTRLMTQKPDADGKLPYQGLVQSVMKIAREEGFLALMKGWVPRVFYLGPLASIVFAMYEYIGKTMLLRRGPNWCRVSPVK